MSISGAFLTAKNNGVVITGNYQWDADESSQDLGRTTGADQGFRNEDSGIQSLDVQIRGYMDVTTGAYVQIEAGTILTNLSLYRDENDALAAYVLPLARVSKSHQGAVVEGKVEWTATIHNKGTYTCNDP